ncbi:MAG: hypothetical protein CEE43_14710 [Promethearchaeota archaeon Loki_b32]|nr:MAG: hypothetical protein CEE43_14710 [Candidatus Lokiarchaeota archaeon Loki_b32]
MHKNLTKSIYNKKKIKTIVITFIFLIILLFNVNFFNQSLQYNNIINNDTEDFGQYDHNLESANGETILFEEIGTALNINDTGVLYKSNQEIMISNQEDLNLSYYLDETNNWKVSRIETTINNLQDTRNWVNNSGFQPVTIFRKNQTFESAHYPYVNMRTRLTIDNTIQEDGAIYIRAHFSNISFDERSPVVDSDHIYLYNKSAYEYFEATGYREDFYSPWTSGDTIYVCYETDNQNNNEYGYFIDYYEFVNDSSNLNLNTKDWKFNHEQSGLYGANTYGCGEIRNATAMFVGYHGDWENEESFTYYADSFSEIYQENISIPRGKIVDAYLSFNYYVEFGFTTNDILMYLAINDKVVYSKGMLTIIESGKSIWHKTGNIPLYLWNNLSRVFETKYIQDQLINVSIGIKKAGISNVTYSNYDDIFGNIIWFDNISLGITTIANATQDGINLTIDNIDFQDQAQWGRATLNLTKGWNTDPVILSLNTTSPELSFNLNTTLYGYHETFSNYNQLYDQGVSYKILENGTIFWTLYHYLYMPPTYEEFEFKIEKPRNWEFLSVLDPFLQTRYFEGGNLGDDYIFINSSNALFAGWYTLTATSPNYLDLSNTKLLKQGQWVQKANFTTSESTQISTQLDYMGDIPDDVGNINLTVYHPNGTIFYEESQTHTNGNVTFSQITFGAFNTIGGLYEYTLVWSNGTALGGLKSDFIVKHQSSITLLKPDDAKIDLRTEGFVGDLIPVRIFLKDSENNLSISNAVVPYNWTDGTRLFTESASGIYETVLNSGDLGTRGLYNIIISSVNIGFVQANLTLEINLGEETNIQVLESDYNIELHANSTIRFKFTNFGGEGIDGALVNISISNESLYTINNPGNSIYNIEFSTLFINEIGIYQLSINFSAVAYEPQYYIYQFQIIQQSVNLSSYIDSQEINENALKTTKFNEHLNISARAISNIDQDYISGGVITFICGTYQKVLAEKPNFWFNTTILLSPENFSLGINLVYLKFEHSNYRTSTFSFQLIIDQIEINIDPISFEDSIIAEIGDTINIQIELLDPKTNISIENASVRYSWEYGLGTLNETTPGIYQAYVELPANLRGTYGFDLIITPDESTYQTTQYSFVVVIGDPIVSEPGFPSYLLWIIIGVLISIVSALGVLSLRTYVYMPRKRKREAELISKTQRFKDLKNIQAIVIVHKLSGIPIYSQSYSILEKHKKELFSGFIQAITMIGEEFVEKEVAKPESAEAEGGYGVEKMIELDFKQFYCLIADIEDMRAVFILKERSSERLKSQISHLILALNLKLSKELENWDGSLDEFEILIPEILNEYFELYYKEAFRLATDINLIKMKKEKKLTKMEMRIVNVIQSMSKDNIITNLNNIVELVSEENKNLIIDAIESLIKQKLIIPLND